jgi:hypothetical protein
VNKSLTIVYDEPQEAVWFRELHPSLRDAIEEAISVAKDWPSVQRVLAYDRPDIILLHGGAPILVIEETVEVPSGHNVGQRFARIAAAAECGVPCLYFGPYVAQKHGGETAGPRYMNVRLFMAIDAMIRTTKTAITTINWPVDQHFEVRRDRDKDRDVREYMATFFSAYEAHGLTGTNRALLASAIHKRMVSERDAFVSKSIRKPEQYDGPPPSVELLSSAEFSSRFGIHPDKLPPNASEVVLYNVGMNYIRSDPYTGMAMLYKFLYIAEHPQRCLILWFPNITCAMWRAEAGRGNRKDIKLYRISGDAILFADDLLLRSHL